MKVLIDHQIFSWQRYGGISRYFANLYQGLNQIPGVSCRVGALYSANEYLKDEPLLLNNIIGSSIFNADKDKIYKWNRRYCRWNIRQNNFDIFHPTYFDPDFIKYLRKPFVITIHDMIYELMPDVFDRPAVIIEQKRQLIAKADAIIAISQHTKQDLLKFYPEAEGKVTVIYHGIVNKGSAVSNTNSFGSYILYVGDRWHYKNFTKLINAIGPILNQNKDLTLICAGGGSFTEEELALLSNKGIVDQCRQMNADDQTLAQLYQGAQLFVFPSLQEGFGLPILEAFTNNCPVVCSNTTSLPEVGGEAAIYFDPHSEDSIAKAITKVLFDKGLQQDLRQKGTEQLKKFSFDNCLQETLKVYKSVL